jgi:P27 family predicted phage terminase small subunit
MPRRDNNYVRALKGKKPRIPLEEQIRYPVIQAVGIVPPDYLTEESMVHWNRMVAILDGIKLFQAPTRDSLARYCQACADYEQLQMDRKRLGKRKHTVTEDNYNQLQFQARMLREYTKVMEQFEEDYGLTPASAAKVRHPGASTAPGMKLANFVDTKPALE